MVSADGMVANPNLVSTIYLWEATIQIKEHGWHPSVGPRDCGEPKLGVHNPLVGAHLPAKFG